MCICMCMCICIRIRICIRICICICSCLEEQPQRRDAVVLRRDVERRPAAAVLRVGPHPSLEEQPHRARPRACRVGAGAALDGVVQRSPPLPVGPVGVGAGVEQYLESLGAVVGGGGVAGGATLPVGRADLGPVAQQHLGRLGRIRPPRQVQRTHPARAPLVAGGARLEEERADVRQIEGARGVEGGRSLAVGRVGERARL